MKLEDQTESTSTSNVTDLSEFKSKKVVEELKQRGPLTKDIYSIAETLEQNGWEINFGVHDIEDFTAYADYTNKRLITNISSAFYAAHLMSRLAISVEPNEYGYSAHGIYKYYFGDGEKIFNDDGTHYHFLYLQVESVKEFPDVEIINLM